MIELIAFEILIILSLIALNFFKFSKSYKQKKRNKQIHEKRLRTFKIVSGGKKKLR